MKVKTYEYSEAAKAARAYLLNLEKERDELKAEVQRLDRDYAAARKRIEELKEKLTEYEYYAGFRKLGAQGEPEMEPFAEVDALLRDGQWIEIVRQYVSPVSVDAKLFVRTIIAEAVRQMRREMATLHEKYGAEAQSGIAQDIVTEMAKQATKWEEAKWGK